MTRSKGKIPFKSKSKFAVVVDGKTEYWYLKMMQRNERNPKIDIKPEIPQKKKLVDQFKKVKELSKIYDKAIWIIDLDVILKESRLQEFLDYKKTIERSIKNVITIINQPCLEYWLLLHFTFKSPHFSNCDEAEKLLSTYLSDYSKTQKYFTNQDNDIYLKTRKNLPLAIENSKKLGRFNSDNPYKGYSEMYKIFQGLGIE